MGNCLLCSNCSNEFEGENETGYYYVCGKRELEGDGRFPYMNTKCNKFIRDTSVVSLAIKEISKELWNEITWKIE